MVHDIIYFVVRINNMVAVVKRSTRRIVAPLLEGSNPSSHPTKEIHLKAEINSIGASPSW